MGKYINGPADGSPVVHIPQGVREVCRRPPGTDAFHHYIRASENFYWVGRCDHEPLFPERDDGCCCPSCNDSDYLHDTEGF